MVKKCYLYTFFVCTVAWPGRSSRRHLVAYLPSLLIKLYIFKTFFQTEQLTDIDIVIGHGNDIRVLRAHKVVLAATSLYFRDLIVAGSQASVFQNCDPGTIKIVERTVTPQEMTYLLDFMYTGDISVHRTVS